MGALARNNGTKIPTVAVSVTTVATVVLAANTNRSGAYIFNNHTATIYLGNAAVTTANGIPLPAATGLWDVYTNDAWYAIIATATADVRVLEIG